MKKKQQKPNKDGKMYLTICLSKEMHAKIAERAKQDRDRPLSAMARLLIEDAMREAK